MSNPTELKNWYAGKFKKFEESLNGESMLSIHETRKAALEKFLELKFPTLKDEAWKYTNITPLFAHKFEDILTVKPSIKGVDAEKYLFDKKEFYTIVFINGVYVPELSDEVNEPGITLCNLKTALTKYTEDVSLHIAKFAKIENSIFTALSTAYINDGVFLKVKSGNTLSKPVQVLYVNSGGDNLLIQPRNLFIIGKNAQAKVVESYYAEGESIYFTNVVTESYVDQNGVFEHIKIQEESEKAFHISITEIDVEKQSKYSSYNINFGGELVRNDLNARFNGEYGHVTLNGLYLTQGIQHVDNQTLIEHAVPNCESHEMYKGVLDDQSRGVFNGKVYVKKDAQKTNAFQENKNVMLSDFARVDAKPQLEIYADDVKCSHGATVGRLSEEALFYLRARGIGQELAKTMIINAFANDAVHSISIDEVRRRIEDRVAVKLDKQKNEND
ncbi:MAG: Fe-S cluster assembly protein SufD [Ignavibacteriales bacterium]|nr:MAG: Fe-S cluster assembly protein SufD [Ignavibacteriaceae bacterium]MBW7872095.1 Fe-S cluster assembly protein SufD [Ignavibacteria bacterium]MCZ2143729.1 Fe-S cluster assembly protein SufD [Ignavibacteriales bacterium]OQY77567.1 MAG: Fe-S cluster assembly protein SufD [Ignavibacteriales bacterium UTCHB3]MBV6446009.1 FeS cluster assembly protein SufD [Ignavibacteriaceae bacterium]